MGLFKRIFRSEPVQRIEIARPLAGPPLQGTGPVKTEDTGWVPVPAKDRPKTLAATTELERRQITLASGPASYSLTYQRLREGKDKPWRAHTEALSGLGLLSPDSANFYGGGFFDLVINGVSLRTVTPELELRRGAGKAAVDVRWEMPSATVSARFLALGGDGALYAEVELAPSVPVSQLDLKLLSFAGGFHGERDRAFRTPQGEFGHDPPLAAGPDTAWLLLYDRRLNPGTGAAALAFASGQFDGLDVRAPSNYGMDTTVRLKPGQRRLHFALWNLYQASNERALERIRAESGPAIERLGTPERLFTVATALAKPAPKPAGVK